MDLKEKNVKKEDKEMVSSAHEVHYYFHFLSCNSKKKKRVIIGEMEAREIFNIMENCPTNSMTGSKNM